jgi:hypothetical protein
MKLKYVKLLEMEDGVMGQFVLGKTYIIHNIYSPKYPFLIDEDGEPHYFPNNSWHGYFEVVE